MNYLSVCSGIEAASVAWQPLGWHCVGVSEIEKFPCAVLAHRWPDVPNFGDLTKSEDWDVPEFNVLVGGTPCQGFSVAGKRGGMDDPRSQLAWRFLDLARKHRPRWVLWENVPGALSSNGGADFGAILGGLAERGYGFAYRVLDAQYFGVAQRRRRVFVVGYFGDWRPAAAVLFERESMSGHPPPSREPGEGAAGSVASCIRGGGAGTSRVGDTRGQDNVVAHTLKADGFDASEDGTGRGTPLVPVVSPALKSRDHKGPSSDGDGDGAALIPTVAPPLLSGGGTDASHSARSGHAKEACLIPVAFNLRGREGGAMPEANLDGISPALRVSAGGGGGGSSNPYLATKMAVRRLTPRECERLQGFEDDYTLIPYGKKCPDGPRYKALGNSMAVPCMVWLGKRIALVDGMVA